MIATFPDMHKIAKVIPVHKGRESVNDNYRPISLLPVLTRILENIVNVKVRKHLETNNIFLGKQHGFRQQHSTETALSESVGNLAEAFDKKHKAIAALLTQGKLLIVYNIIFYYLN